MTVGEYLRSLVFGIELPDNVIERCAYSPREVGLKVVDVNAEAYPENPEDDWQMRLDYASSTVYYSVLCVFAGGGYTEKVGDVQVSRNGFTVTQADRTRYKSMADALRRKWGFDPEDDAAEGGMYDPSYTRYR